MALLFPQKQTSNEKQRQKRTDKTRTYKSIVLILIIKRSPPPVDPPPLVGVVHDCNVSIS